MNCHASCYISLAWPFTNLDVGWDGWHGPRGRGRIYDHLVKELTSHQIPGTCSHSSRSASRDFRWSRRDLSGLSDSILVLETFQIAMIVAFLVSIAASRLVHSLQCTNFALERYIVVSMDGVAETRHA